MLLTNTVLAIEALHPAGGINEPLGAGVEGMAFRADLDADIRHRRMRFENVPAGAGHYAAAIFWMNSSFHLTLSAFLHSATNNIIAGLSAQFTSATAGLEQSFHEIALVHFALSNDHAPLPYSRLMGCYRRQLNISIADAACTGVFLQENKLQIVKDCGRICVATSLQNRIRRSKNRAGDKSPG